MAKPNVPLTESKVNAHQGPFFSEAFNRVNLTIFLRFFTFVNWQGKNKRLNGDVYVDLYGNHTKVVVNK
jgi:hypothetical protein